jgi:hypothetical protein
MFVDTDEAESAEWDLDTGTDESEPAAWVLSEPRRENCARRIASSRTRQMVSGRGRFFGCVWGAAAGILEWKKLRAELAGQRTDRIQETILFNNATDWRRKSRMV